MPGVVFDIPVISADTSPPIVRNDTILSNGSFWLFDPSHSFGGFLGVPATGTILPNIAWDTAAEIIGSGNANALGTHLTLIGNAADVTYERTEKGGFHTVMSHNGAYVDNFNGCRIAPNASLQAYLDAHVDDDWYFSYWALCSRAIGGGLSVYQSPMHKGNNNANYLFANSRGGTPIPGDGDNFLGNRMDPASGRFDTIPIGTPVFRAVGTTGYTGTRPTMTGSGLGANSFGVALVAGNQDSWSGLNDNYAPSYVHYRGYIENLTLSGRSFSEVAAIDNAMFTAAFGPGGKFYGDVWTDPATLLP